MLNLVWSLIRRTDSSSADSNNSQALKLDSLSPIRQWLNALEIRNATLARFICRVVPVQCPFERDIRLLGYTFVHIPPLCKFNPLYEEIVYLRFRALCYLADECGEDIRCYC
jgi:hypothetical protein